MKGLLKTKEISVLHLLLTVLISILFGAGLYYYIFDIYNKTASTESLSIRENDPSLPLIHPLLGSNNPEIKTTTPLKEALEKAVELAQNTKKAKVVAVYYRDLNTGKWFGINQDETFIPASLFKVPVMITYLKDAETDPDILNKKILNNLTSDQNVNESIKALKTVTPGKTYTVEELLHYMVEYSDNNATVLLFKYINQDTLKKVFSDLDIQSPTSTSTDNFISVGNYSFLFRVLYNATYLTHRLSEKGLEMLSKIDFEDGIRKGISDNTVTVADKFGEYFLIDKNGNTSQHQLHDCGIVYQPKHPYLLCIMTKGESLDNLKQVIQQISQITYTTVNAMK
jgi:beta-lactamase class A